LDKRNCGKVKPQRSMIMKCFIGILLACSVLAQVNADDGWAKSLDTARNTAYLSAIEKDVVFELNKVRSNPKRYAELYIRPRLDWFGGAFGANSFLAPGKTVYTSTREGPKGVRECIADLSKTSAMPPLAPREGLFKAAKDHTADIGAKGQTGHTGSDGSSMSDRLARYGKWDGGSGENLSFGQDTAQDIVVQLLIDDGVSNRGHRKNILNKSFAFVGASVGTHKRYGSMCTMDFANHYLTTGNAEEKAQDEAIQQRQAQEESDKRAADWGNIAELDVGRNLDYLSNMEKDIILEVNMARNNPEKYARLYIPGKSGKAYEHLMGAQGLPPMTVEKGLCLGLKEDGSAFTNAEKYGKSSGSMSGPSLMGGYKSGREVVMSLLASFGSDVTGASYIDIGVAVKDDAKWGSRISCIFATNYTSNE
jgi:hypothetical protein